LGGTLAATDDGRPCGQGDNHVEAGEKKAAGVAGGKALGREYRAHRPLILDAGQSRPAVPELPVYLERRNCGTPESGNGEAPRGASGFPGDADGQEAPGRDRRCQLGHELVRVIVVRDQLRDRDEHHGDRLAEVQQFGLTEATWTTRAITMITCRPGAEVVVF